MKIWVVCQYFKPEVGAPSARLSGFAKAWQSMEQDVTVLTGLPNHPKGVLHDDYKGCKSYFDDEVEGVPVKRHWLYITPNQGFVKKTLQHLSFAWSLLRQNFFKKVEDKPDVIMVSSPSFFAVISTWMIAKKLRVPFVFEVRDLWPGIFVELGVLKKGFILTVLEKIELFLYRRAAAVVAVTKGFAQDIANRGIDPQKLFVVTNGCADAEIDSALDPLEDGRVDKLRSELQITPMTKVLLYIGAHGGSQALGQIVDAARTMMHRSDVVFLFVGDGADKARVEKLAQGMPNIQFVGSVNKEKVWAFYNLAYASFVPLKDIPGFDTFIPSKMFEIWAAKTPVIGAVRGEAAEIMKASQGAVVVEPEQPAELAKAIESLVDNTEKVDRLGEAGHQFVRENYAHSKLAGRYLALLNKVVLDHDRR